MQKEFRYRLDKRTRLFTYVIALLLLVALGFFMLYSSSGYFPIWFTFFIVTILLLYILSIPRKIRVTEKAFEINCVVELTSVALEDISVIRKMDKSEMKYSVPLLGSYGFFGYYGWFYNVSEFSLFKVYTTQWKNFVRIDDIYETIYVVNCDDPDGLIAAVKAAREQRMEELKQEEAAL